MTQQRWALWVLPHAAVMGALVLCGQELPLAFGVGSVAGGSSLLGSLWFDRRQRASLRRLRQAAAAAAAGDLDAQSEVTGSDDIGKLARALNRVADRWAKRLRQLEDHAQTLTAVMDGISEGLWVTDPDGHVVRHNSALKAMLSPRPAAARLLGQRPLSLLRNNELHEAVQRACRRSESSSLEVSVPGAPPRILSVHVSPLAKDVRGSAAVFHDVTELRRLEKVRKDFVANVSHELRTPITAIRGYAETLKDGALADPEHAAQMVGIIHRQSERLSELVEDLLELSRLETKELRLSAVPVQLQQAAVRAAEAIRLRAEGKGLLLDIDVPQGLCALADPRAVEQVVQNLLDNAVKYTPAGGKVRVSGSKVDKSVLLSVQDTGVGIAAHQLPRVFERFYRVDAGRSRDMGGTGLGLAIVKHLASAMNGDIRVESQPEKGSTFTLCLPCSLPQQDEKVGG